MTRDEFKAALELAGFRSDTVNAALASHDRGDHPKLNVFQRENIGYDLFNISMNFHTDGLDTRFLDGRAGLLQVPIAHSIIGGINTATLEARIAVVPWSHDHKFLADELPDNAEAVRNATVIAPGIFSDLARLYSHSHEGKLVAEQLCCRHIIPQMGEDGNSPLLDLVGEKYYATQPLHGITPVKQLYGELLMQPAKNIDISPHIEKLIQRQLNYYLPITKTPIIMNLNNLANLKDEMRELRFNEKLLPEMEDKMAKSVPDFQLHDSRIGNRGNVDFTLHFKKSSQSDFYYLNKYDVYLNKTEPLQDGQKYMVISKGEDDKPVFRSFQNPHEAIEYFKGQKGDSELAMGKNPGNKATLATMEKDKVNYVSKDFQKTYYAPPITHTMYVDQGKGFTAEQAANLLQGRTVYRDDLINMGGQPYKAWVMFDMDKGKDRNNNFQTRQFNDPGYGFDLSESLKEFNIKELADPAKMEKIEESLRQGNRPLVTVMLEGKETKLHIEAVPRYGKMNFYQENGKPEKREQFERSAKVAQMPERSQNRELAQGRAVGR